MYYGEPRVENRQRMWDTLANLCSNSDLPWMLIGDFNEALWHCEHLSVMPRANSQMSACREMLQQYVSFVTLASRASRSLMITSERAKQM